MLVPEFYFRGWEERRAGSGGMFGDPQGPQWCKSGGAGDMDAGAWAKRGCWVALRDLGSKLGSPSTLGSLASNCKASYLAGGGGSSVGGEVTGIRGGRQGLFEPGELASFHSQPSSASCPEALRGELPLQPRPALGQGPCDREPAEGKLTQAQRGAGAAGGWGR